ncbi:MAG: DNA gyrase C-terminal beta-propeller domain-containing protein, partial [Chloroflexota bacterium]
HLMVCDTHDSLLLFTLRGRVYSIKGYEVPEASRQARGVPVVNIVEIEPDDRVTAVVGVQSFEHNSMILATAHGEVKRTPLNQFESVRRSGLIAMDLPDGDELIDVQAAADDADVMIVSSDGQAIRFAVDSLRVASRASGGVRGMKLEASARVIAMVIAVDGEDLLVVSERGIGKRTAISEYRRTGRGGQGVLSFRVTARSGPLSVALVLNNEHELIIVSREGIMMRTRADLISQQGRATQGVSIMNIGDDDAVASIAQIDLAIGTSGE